MQDIDGTWGLVARSPMGVLTSELTIKRTDAGVEGSVVAMGTTVELEEATVNEDNVEFSTRVTVPMRMKVKYSLSFSGEDVTGTMKPGMMPVVATTGTRISK